MARLIYTSNMSLDGCTEDERGAFDWAPPDEDVSAFITRFMQSARQARTSTAGACTSRRPSGDRLQAGRAVGTYG